MKICPKCNASNRDEAKFCVSCGENLTAQSLNTSTSSAVNDGSAFGTTPPGTPAGQPATGYLYTGEPQPQAAPPRKKPAIFIAIAAIVIVAAAAVFLAVKLLANSNDPVTRLMKGYAKLLDMKKITVTTTIEFNSDYEGEDTELDTISRVINDLGIRFETAADTEDLVFQIGMEFLYDDKSVIRMAAGLNDEEAYIDAYDLYDKKFYVAMGDLVPQYTDFINDFRIIRKAAGEVKSKIDQKKIAKIIRDSLGDNIRNSGDKVILTLDNDIIIDLVNDLVDGIGEDKKLLESVRQYCVDLLKGIIKEEDNLKKIRISVFEDLLEKFEDKEEFEEFYINRFSAIFKKLADPSERNLESLEALGIDPDAIEAELPEIDMADVEELEITFSFDKSGAISRMEYSGVFDANGLETEMLISTVMKNGAKFTKIDREKAVDIVELADDTDMQLEVADQVMDNLKEIILDNAKLAELIEELSGMDPGDAFDFIKMMLLYQLQFGGW